MKPSEIYNLWDKVIQCEISLKESGIKYKVDNSVGYGADVCLYGDVSSACETTFTLLIPRYLYDELGEV